MPTGRPAARPSTTLENETWSTSGGLSVGYLFPPFFFKKKRTCCCKLLIYHQPPVGLNTCRLELSFKKKKKKRKVRRFRSRWVSERKEKDELPVRWEGSFARSNDTWWISSFIVDRIRRTFLPVEAFYQWLHHPKKVWDKKQKFRTYSQRVIPSFKTWAKSSWSRRPSAGWG